MTSEKIFTHSQDWIRIKWKNTGGQFQMQELPGILLSTYWGESVGRIKGDASVTLAGRREWRGQWVIKTCEAREFNWLFQIWHILFVNAWTNTHSHVLTRKCVGESSQPSPGTKPNPTSKKTQPNQQKPSKIWKMLHRCSAKFIFSEGIFNVYYWRKKNLLFTSYFKRKFFLGESCSTGSHYSEGL